MNSGELMHFTGIFEHFIKTNHYVARNLMATKPTFREWTCTNVLKDVNRVKFIQKSAK